MGLKPRTKKKLDPLVMWPFDYRFLIWAVDQTYLYLRKSKPFSGVEADAAVVMCNEELRLDLWTQSRRFWATATGAGLWGFSYMSSACLLEALRQLVNFACETARKAKDAETED